MQLDQCACGHEVVGRIQEHGIKWQTTREQVDRGDTCGPESDSLSTLAEVIAAPQQEPKPKM